MTLKPQLDQTDQLILYLVTNLTKGVPHLLVESSGVLTTMLAKLLFLVDVRSMQTSGSQATNFRYIRYKYGPYPLAQFEERLEELQSWGLHAIPKVSVIEDRPYRIYRLQEKRKAQLHLVPSIQLLADEVMTTFANQKLEDVLTYVYSLDFVRNVPFGGEIDLRLLRPEEGDALTRVVTAFRLELSSSLSPEHIAALALARREASNENIELARAMIEKQRRAFRRKEGS